MLLMVRCCQTEVKVRMLLYNTCKIHSEVLYYTHHGKINIRPTCLVQSFLGNTFQQQSPNKISIWVRT